MLLIGILPVDPLTPAPLNLSHSLSQCTNAHDQCRNAGELKYEGLCKICYSRKDNRTQWLQKQKPEASEEEHAKVIKTLVKWRNPIWRLMEPIYSASYNILR